MQRSSEHYVTVACLSLKSRYYLLLTFIAVTLTPKYVINEPFLLAENPYPLIVTNLSVSVKAHLVQRGWNYGCDCLKPMSQLSLVVMSLKINASFVRLDRKSTLLLLPIRFVMPRQCITS